MQPTEARWKEHLGAVVACAAVLGVTFLLQPHTTVGGGIGFDGFVYHDIARRVANGEALRGGVPFIYRIGLPLLAGTLSPENLQRGFLLINIPCVLLTALALSALLARTVPVRWARLSCLALFLLQFHGPARFTAFRTFMVDPPGQLSMFAGLYFVHRWSKEHSWRWSAAVAAAAVIGAPFREMALIPAGAMLFAHAPLRWPEGDRRLRLALPASLQQWLPLVVALLAYMTVRTLVTAVHSGHVYSNLAEMALAKLPFALPLGIMLTFGPILLLPLAQFEVAGRFLWREQHLLAAIGATFLVGWIGGSDTERLFFYGAPAVYAVIGVCLGTIEPRKEWSWLLPLLAVQVLAQRVFWLLPDPQPTHGFPFFTTLGPGTSYTDLWGSHAPRAVRWALLAEYALLAAVLGYVMRKRLRPAAASHTDERPAAQSAAS